MSVYIILICAVLFPPALFKINESEKAKKRYLIFVFTLIALAAALRDINVGVDTRQFCNAYVQIGYLNYGQMFALRYEPGFIILCKLLNYISSDYQLLLIVSGGFIAFSFARFIYKNSDDAVTSSLVFLCMFFAQSMNLMRQYIAAAILLYGIEYLKEKKNIKFLVFVALAAMFHYSAVICIVYIIFYRLVISKKLFVFLSAVIVIVLLNFRQILDFVSGIELLRQYSSYIGSRFDAADSTRWVKMAIALLILLFFLLNVKRKDTAVSAQNGITTVSEIRHNFIVNMLFAWVVIETFAASSYIFTRFAPYFDYISVLAVPRALVNIKDKKIRLIFTLLIYAVMIVYFAVSRRANISQIMPYRFFWEV